MDLKVADTPGPITGVERVLGRISGPREGPTLICVGGLHGNETAGVLALERILGSLSSRSSELGGDLVALAGNLGALAAGRRFIHRDLNRSWTRERLEGPQRSRAEGAGEDREQRELLEALERVEKEARGPLFLLDLHTTSGPAVPFSAIKASPANRDFALTLPVPLVLGFGELMEGTFFGYLTQRGITSVVFEGGQHGESASVDASESAVWLALAAAGVIEEGAFFQVSEARKTLRAMGSGLPSILEIGYRHPVSPGDGFRMLPGFKNFQPVVAGELLATDHEGEVRSPGSGRLLLPLYQAQGDDGFFIIKALGSQK